MRITLMTVIGLIACNAGSGEIARQHSRLGSVGFDVPTGWTSQQLRSPQAVSVEWTPHDNVRKESLVIIRSSVGSNIPEHGAARIPELLQAAQFALPRMRALRSEPIDQRAHMWGAHVTDEFTPSGSRESYHREHAVFVDGPTLIHVIYTAVDPEPDAFLITVESLQHEEG